jgi:hypothetical protein
MHIRTHIPTHTFTCTPVSRPSRLRHKRLLLLLLQQEQRVFLCQVSGIVCHMQMETDYFQGSAITLQAHWS